MSTAALDNIQLLNLNGDLPNSASHNNEEEDQIVTPWEVSAGAQTGVDYDKLIGNFVIKKTWP